MRKNHFVLVWCFLAKRWFLKNLGSMLQVVSGANKPWQGA
jgi:hypothetical protein